MNYISSQGGCKGDMCPSSNSSRLNVVGSLCVYVCVFMTGGGGNANAHTQRGNVWVLLQDTAAATAQHKTLYRRDVAGEML